MMQSMIKKRTKGFTLMELMITLAIAAILMGMGMPSYYRFAKRQTITNETNNMISDLHFARLHAINNGVTVKVTSNNGVNWQGGWTITNAATTTVLLQKQAIPGGVTMVGNVGVIEFTSIGGLPITGPPVTITVAHTDVAAQSNVNINVALSGSVSSSRTL